MISSRPKSSPGNRTTNVGGKKCRVLFSYQPAHEDELELKVGNPLIAVLSDAPRIRVTETNR